MRAQKLVLLACGLLPVHASRLADRPAQEALEVQEAMEELHRYRALNKTEMQLFMQGADLPLLASSFQEEDMEDFQLPQQWQSKLQPVKKLGEGSFGKVYECRVLCERDQHVSVSVKLITQKDPQVRQEIDLLKHMRGVSEFCISAIGEPPFIENRQGYWIMMPMMNGGELHDFLMRCQRNNNCLYGDSQGRKVWTAVDPTYTTPYILALFDDIVHGVEALHKTSGLLHIDLKPQNVMLNCRGKKCFAAVIDLGIACNPRIPGDCGQSGTPVYMPPEVWRGDRHGMNHPGRDIWALGIILYQLMYRNLPPFFSDPRRQVDRYDVDRDPNIPSPQKKVDTLVAAMLHHDYAKRPDLRQIKRVLKELVGLSSDYAPDPEAVNMMSQAPAQRGASVATPTCLDEPSVPHREAPPPPVQQPHREAPPPPVQQPHREAPPPPVQQPHRPAPEPPVHRLHRVPVQPYNPADYAPSGGAHWVKIPTTTTTTLVEVRRVHRPAQVPNYVHYVGQGDAAPVRLLRPGIVQNQHRNDGYHPRRDGYDPRRYAAPEQGQRPEPAHRQLKLLGAKWSLLESETEPPQAEAPSDQEGTTPLE